MCALLSKREMKHRNSGLCRVCEETSRGLHFGVIACRACAAFFRRSVALELRYKCRSAGACNIHKCNYRPFNFFQLQPFSLTFSHSKHDSFRFQPCAACVAHVGIKNVSMLECKLMVRDFFDVTSVVTPFLVESKA